MSKDSKLSVMCLVARRGARLRSTAGDSEPALHSQGEEEPARVSDDGAMGAMRCRLDLQRAPAGRHREECEWRVRETYRRRNSSSNESKAVAHGRWLSLRTNQPVTGRCSCD